MSLWPKIREELDAMVISHFDTPETNNFFLSNSLQRGKRFSICIIRTISRADVIVGPLPG